MDNRNILIGMAIRHQGKWHDIYQALKEKETIEDEEIYGYLTHLKCNVITILDQEYPEYLRKVTCPPFVLFYYGDISLIYNIDKNLAIVGSRDASQNGLNAIYNIAEKVSKTYNIVSGLALGIDAAAHHGAIDGGGKTIGILGCGIEQCYPISNQSLYDEIKSHHLLISEYYNYIPPHSYNFPQRNRLIVAFSRATLVGEARLKSGSSITASITLAENKDLMVIPSNELDNSLCNQLIRDGCSVVLNADDVLYYLK